MMGSAVRFFVGLPVAVAVTGVLFLFMSVMIRQDPRLAAEKPSVSLDIFAKINDTDLTGIDAELKKPELNAPPPPPPAIVNPADAPDPGDATVDVPEIDMELDIKVGLNADRDAQPIVRIPPQYPDRCMSRADPEEVVVVEFDVTPEGQTTNIRIFDSSNSCMDRSAIRAVERWKYRPKMVDGVAMPRRGVRTSLNFLLAEED